MRIDIIDKEQRNQDELIKTIFLQEGLKLEKVFSGRSYWFHGGDFLNSTKTQETLKSFFADDLNTLAISDIKEIDYNYIIEVSFRPGVTDNRSKASSQLLKEILQGNFELATGELFFLKTNLNKETIKKELLKHFGNHLLQRINLFHRSELEAFIPSPSFPKVHLTSQKVETIDFNISDEKLIQLSQEKLWALELNELHLIRDYYKRPTTITERLDLGLPELPTDIEIEVLAQTWSEHCKHKIFAANIEYTEDKSIPNPLGDKKINGVFNTFIKKGTRDIKDKFNIDWLISVFSDNAGIVRFEDNIDYCIKVETHNSPSALDPYGGALTGILGVNRDILGCGLGAKPIANSNVLCFAPINYSQKILEELPPKLRHPKTILRGVHKGIEDGGNKSGVPTVNGAIHFHDNYAGKPLVYCGTLGVLPQKILGKASATKGQTPGDKIVVVGGKVGADGIHGATFSSLEMDDNSPSTTVQIGDPLTQKRVTDFLLKARDLLLYSGVTDNGAGGISSSIGEMAEQTGGAILDLSNVPLKYQGLSPYEIMISESQERMSFSVPPSKIEEFMNLANEMGVEASILGEFSDHGRLDILWGKNLISSLSIGFMHDELPPLELKAHYKGPQKDISWHKKEKATPVMTIEESIKELLAHPNIKSKENLIRQFDHEVQAATVVKPFTDGYELNDKQLSGPNNAGVIWSYPHGGSTNTGVALGSGICPQFSHLDPYYMTQLAIDESIRNIVSVGVDPKKIALCDNYCWPDPIQSKKNPDGEQKLAALVRSGQALYDTSLEYGTPFVSGKDSMKNDFRGVNKAGKETKISVPPTLLITSIGHVPKIESVTTSEFKGPNKEVYFIGTPYFTKEYFSTLNPSIEDLPPFDAEKNISRYHKLYSLIKNGTIESCHDISEGGLVCALIESCFAGGFGFEFAADSLGKNENLSSLLFNEYSGSFIVSISPQEKAVIKEAFPQTELRYLGKTKTHGNFILENNINLSINELYKIWSKDEY